MKVLTLWQPWATLYAHGVKKIETRPQPTNYRGTYLIHAAKTFNKAVKETIYDEPFYSELKKLGFVDGEKINIPFGQIIGAVDIITCGTIDEELSVVFPDIIFTSNESWEEFKNWDKELEPKLGDYTPGRYAWIGKNHRVLKNPIPYKGSQGYYANFKGDESQLIFK